MKTGQVRTSAMGFMILPPTLKNAFDRPFGAQRTVRLSEARKTQFEGIAVQAFGLLSMGSVLTALIALKTAVHVWRLPV